VDEVFAQQLAAHGRAIVRRLAREVLGFTGPEAKEGVASHREKRKPSFPAPPDDF